MPASVDDSGVRLAWTTEERDVVATVAWVSRRRRWLAAALAGLGAALVAVGGWRVGSLGYADVAVALLAVGMALHLLWLRPRVVAWQLRRADPRSRSREPQSLTAGRDGVVHTIGGRENSHGWGAFQRIVVARDHLFLHLSSVHVVAVPRRVFGSESVERRALTSLRAWHRRAGAPIAVEPDEPGLDAFVLRYVLSSDDVVAFAQLLQRRDLRARPALALGGLGLLGLVVLVGGPLSEGRIDAMTVGFVVAFALVMGLLGAGPYWAPSVVTPLVLRWALWRDPARLPAGDVDLRLGPAGGWCRSVRGECRFRWSDVTAVLEGPGLVAILFSPLTGILVPERALGTQREELLARCRAWAGDRGPELVDDAVIDAPIERRPPGEVPDPFAPPGTS